ncbi:MAG: type II secretion system protein [Pseudomonadota bacterium]
MRSKQTGFTMIELIVVIVILGILSAVALPRFTNIQGDARRAKLNAARGAIASASAMVHGSAIVRQGLVQPVCLGSGAVPTAPTTIAALTGNGQLCTENGNIDVNRLYPSATLAGVVAVAGLVPGNVVPTAATLATEGYAAVAAGGVVTVQVPGGSNPATCAFTYTAPAALGAAPVISQLTAATTAGC